MGNPIFFYLNRLLLQKLKSYGISGCVLSWIENYLSLRKQSVRVKNEVSSPSNITSGVIQDQFWDLSFFFSLLMTWTTRLPTLCCLNMLMM